MVSIKGLNAAGSFDLVLHEKLKLLQSLYVLEADLVLLEAIAKESLYLFLQEDSVALDFADSRRAGMYLLEAIALHAIDQHVVVVGHIHHGRRVGFDQPPLRQRDARPAPVGYVLQHLRYRFFGFDDFDQGLLGSL